MGFWSKLFHKEKSKDDEYHESEETKKLTNAIPFMPLNHPQTIDDTSEKKNTS